MRLPLSLVLAVLVTLVAANRRPTKRTYDSHDYYVIHHDPHSGSSLADVASALGVELVEQAGELEDHWLVRTDKPTFEARDGHDRVLKRFEHLQSPVGLTARSNAREIVDSVKLLQRQVLRQRVKRAPVPQLRASPEDEEEERPIAEIMGIEDPLFPQQWHLVNEDYPEHMMNVTGLWLEGITGKGVISSFVDDGLDYTSLDLKDNFDAPDSHDFNDHEDLPTPKLFNDHHGTRCAGQVAAGKNSYCGIGIAYESKVAGVRILSGRITDVDEAAALNFGFQNVSVYSCSWGPPDNGRAMEGPDILISRAVLNGINKGRAGKGSVFVFASGNGAAHGDQCNFDGYTNSIYSVTVSAIDYKGLHPYYSEPCAANMIVAYSSGSGQHIVTTDRGVDKCATTHGGTSAAAPNAAGVFALALQVRPELTWRDIQHLCVETAFHINPEDPDWEPTAHGRPYSYKYGFGSLDGYTYVKKAQDWKLVKPQTWFTTDPVQLGHGTMSKTKVYSGGDPIPVGGIKSTLQITPATLLKNNFEKLEHINIQVWINHTRRGDVEVELVSPNGIRSVLGGRRTGDKATTGYPGWTFMTVKHWGEDPIGDWTIRVSDQENPEFNGSFIGWRMMLWGSVIDPTKAALYELPAPDLTFPPPAPSSLPVAPTATTTRQHAKPTVDPEHATAHGENTQPAFPMKSTTSMTTGIATSTSTASSAASTPAGDVAWFTDMSNLIASQKWFFGAVAAVVLFVIGAGVFFWRRRIINRGRSEYTTLPQAGDDSQMTGLMTNRSTRSTTTRRAPTTKALYDALGELSDDDADEDSRLRPESHRMERLGFHSGFLDDDDPPSAGGPKSAKYHDEPGPAAPPSRVSSPSEGSGDGSWEHASTS